MNATTVTEGQSFGRLITTTRRVLQTGRRPCQAWECRCTCGRVVVVRQDNLKNGHTQSCGCLWLARIRESNGTHGMRGRTEYAIWQGMKNRCGNPNVRCFKNYGRRGITMSVEWLSSFETFFADMGPRPSGRHSIDRIDVDGPYSKENCRWLTMKEQSRNRRDNSIVEFRGHRLPLVQHAEAVGLPYKSVWARIHTLGWPVEDALTRPIQRQRHADLEDK